MTQTDHKAIANVGCCQGEESQLDNYPPDQNFKNMTSTIKSKTLVRPRSEWSDRLPPALTVRQRVPPCASDSVSMHHTRYFNLPEPKTSRKPCGYVNKSYLDKENQRAKSSEISVSGYESKEP